MSDRIARDVSGSSSDSEASSEPDGVGAGGHSPLGAVGQDRDVRSTESGGGGSSSRGSLTSPGHDESRGLGARPRRKTEGKEGKGSKRHHHHAGKGVEWNKKDRRAARVHRGEGQKLAAGRAAEAAAEEAARNARDAAEGRGRDKRDDGSGLIATRAEGPRTHHHGHHHGKRTEPKHGKIDTHTGRLGKVCSFLVTAVAIGGPLAALMSLLSIISNYTAGPGTQGSTSASDPALGRGTGPRQVLPMVVYLLLSMCVIA
ncbi:hypothetical protein, partial [Candidatus Ichthyocystis sparus]|uniref:hypothetical protein n=1 Tax=Candidatus Ichthyocystis sparus TaxID=1561004 RepID=UPI00114695F0